VNFQNRQKEEDWLYSRTIFDECVL